MRTKDEGESKLSERDQLMEEKKTISRKKHLLTEDKERIDKLYSRISKECEEREWKKLQKVLGSLDTQEGNNNIWRQMKKAYPKKVKTLPTGVKNIEGKVIRNSQEKDNIILKHFVHRMRKRPVKENVKELHKINEDLFKKKKLKLATSVNSPPFTMQELESTLKKLMSIKSRDPDLLVCEIF